MDFKLLFIFFQQFRTLRFQMTFLLTKNTFINTNFIYTLIFSFMNGGSKNRWRSVENSFILIMLEWVLSHISFDNKSLTNESTLGRGLRCRILPLILSKASQRAIRNWMGHCFSLCSMYALTSSNSAYSIRTNWSHKSVMVK